MHLELVSTYCLTAKTSWLVLAIKKVLLTNYGMLHVFNVSA